MSEDLRKLAFNQGDIAAITTEAAMMERIKSLAVAVLLDPKTVTKSGDFLMYCVNCFCFYSKKKQTDIKEHHKKQVLKKN